MKAAFEKIHLSPEKFFCIKEFKVPCFTSPWHFHPQWELTLIRRGQGLRYVGDSIETFRENDLVFLGPDLPHYWWSDNSINSSSHSLVLHFDPSFSEHSVFAPPEAGKIQKLFVSAQRGVIFCEAQKKEAIKHLLRLHSKSRWQQTCLILEILGILAEEKSPKLLASASFAPELHSRDSQRLTAVFRYVNQNYMHITEHRKAAVLAGLSPSAFSRFFHQRMGKTFTAYVTEIRIGYACRCLMEKDMSILDIAMASGFNNLSNFNRHFLKQKKITPRAWRKKARRENL